MIKGATESRQCEISLFSISYLGFGACFVRVSIHFYARHSGIRLVRTHLRASEPMFNSNSGTWFICAISFTLFYTGPGVCACLGLCVAAAINDKSPSCFSTHIHTHSSAHNHIVSHTFEREPSRTRHSIKSLGTSGAHRCYRDYSEMLLSNGTYMIRP